jgi:hypothetical protein
VTTRTSLTRGLLLAATLVGGLFGWPLDRALVATPAWRELGVQAWAAYSRQADLGAGDVVYPIAAGLLWLLVLAAAVTYRLDRSAPQSAGPPIYLAALTTLGAIATTGVAAPTIQSVGRLGDDPSALQDAFETFTLWGVYVRGACFVLIFVCTVWALIAMWRQPVDRDR